MLTAAVAVGCAEIPVLKDLGETFGNKPAPPSQASVQHGLPASTGADASLLSFLATARRGDATVVSQPDTGARIRVVAGRMYYAASGRYCRRYEYAPADGGASISSGLACKNGDGSWSVERLIVNPNDVNAPQKSATPRPGSS